MPKKNKIGLIGLGAVGSTVAYGLILDGLGTDLVFIDSNKGKAEGELLDLNHGIAFSRQVRLNIGNYSDLDDAELIIITAGANRKEGQSRADLIKVNHEILLSIIDNIIKYTKDAILLIVANPVDTLTYIAQKYSKYPWQRVIGTGTKLDTSRYRFFISQRFNVCPASVHGYVIGNHGPHAIPVWSNASIAGRLLTSFSAFSQAEMTAIEEEVKKAGMNVIQRKQVTNFGIATAVVDIARSILHNEHKVHTVGSIIQGFQGVTDVVLSLPSIVSSKGIEEQIELELSPSEKEKFFVAAEAEKESLSFLQL